MNLGISVARASLDQLAKIDRYAESERCFEDDHRSEFLPKGNIGNPFEVVQPSLMENQMMWISEAYSIYFVKTSLENVAEAISDVRLLANDKCVGELGISPHDRRELSPVKLKLSYRHHYDGSWIDSPFIEISYVWLMVRDDPELADFVFGLFRSKILSRYLTAELIEDNGQTEIRFSNVSSNVVHLSKLDGCTPKVRFEISKSEAFEVYQALAPMIAEQFSNAFNGFWHCCHQDDFNSVVEVWNRCVGGASLTYYACYRDGLDPIERPEFPEGTTFLRIPLFNGGRFDRLLGIEKEVVNEDELPDDVLYNPESSPTLWIDVMHKPEESYLEILSTSEELLEKFIDDSKIEATIWRGNFDDRW